MQRKNKSILLIECESEIVGGGQVIGIQLASFLKDNYDVVGAVTKNGPLYKAFKLHCRKVVETKIGPYSHGPKRFKDFFILIKDILFAVPRLIRIIRDNNISLVYNNCNRTLIFSVIAATITRRPLIFHAHHYPVTFLQLLLTRFLARIPILKTVIAPSRYSASQVGKSNQHKCKVILNGVDTERFKPLCNIRQSMRKSLGCKGNEIVIATAGILTPDKGHHILVRAAGILCKDNNVPDYKFLIIGGESQLFPHYPEYLKKLINQFDLEDKFILTGRREDIAELLNAVSILVVSSVSRFETCSCVMLEGWSTGTVCLVTDIGGPQEMVKLFFEDLQEFLIFKNADPLSLSEKIKNIPEQFFTPKFKKRLREVCTSRLDSRFFKDEIQKVVHKVLLSNMNNV